jgi:hypothetical protein
MTQALDVQVGAEVIGVYHRCTRAGAGIRKPSGSLGVLVTLKLLFLHSLRFAKSVKE